MDHPQARQGNQRHWSVQGGEQMGRLRQKMRDEQGRKLLMMALGESQRGKEEGVRAGIW